MKKTKIDGKQVEKSTTEVVHFFVLVHGNHGHSRDWNKYEEVLTNTFAGSNLWILKSAHNEADTSIGVLKGGELLATEVLSEFDTIRSKFKENEILCTFCAHSLGGLFSRAALEHLFHPSNQERVKGTRWVGLTTICSPHMGELRPPGNTLKNLWNFFVHTYCDILNGCTGDDLIFKTDALKDLANQKYLANFEHVTLVALAHHDMAVPFPTAACSTDNPYPILGFQEPLQLAGTHGFDKNRFANLKMRLTGLLDVACDLRPTSPNSEIAEELVKDNYNHCHLPSESLQNFLSSHQQWRRIDLNIGRGFAAFAHDLPLGKGVVEVDADGANEFIRLLCNIFFIDHA